MGLTSLRLMQQARRWSFDAAFCIRGELRQEGDCRFAWRIVLQNRWSAQDKNDCACVMDGRLHRARLQRSARVMLIHAAVDFMTLRRMHGTHRPAAAIERIGAEPAGYDRHRERQNSENCGKLSHHTCGAMLIPLRKSMQSRLDHRGMCTNT